MKNNEDRWEELANMEYASYMADEIAELNIILRKIRDDNHIPSHIMKSFTRLTQGIDDPRERLEKKIELAREYARGLKNGNST